MQIPDHEVLKDRISVSETDGELKNDIPSRESGGAFLQSHHLQLNPRGNLEVSLMGVFFIFASKIKKVYDHLARIY